MHLPMLTSRDYVRELTSRDLPTYLKMLTSRDYVKEFNQQGVRKSFDHQGLSSIPESVAQHQRVDQQEVLINGNPLVYLRMLTS